MEKTILDCGAGGNMTPLALFANHGYETYGIEFDDDQIERTKEFEKENNISLNIVKGDMRSLPFEDESMSFAYSYNAIFHMTKKDITKSMDEMKRVLKPGGLMFVNFISVEDFGYGQGEEISEGEFRQREGDEEVIHTYYQPNEGEKHFQDMDIIYKESRVLERIYEGEKIKQHYIDYIVRKK